MTMNITKTSEPPTVPAGLPADPPATDAPIVPLDLEESPKVRTKLRLYTILSALYVTYPVLLVLGQGYLLK
jgi:hypothetical protein